MASPDIQAAAWKLYQTSNPGQVPERVILPSTGNRDVESVMEDDWRMLVDPGDINDGGKYRSIVKIFSKFNNNGEGDVWMMGTGWLVSPDTLVTAGHNVFDWTRHLGAASEVKCYIGFYGRESVGKPGVQARFGQSIVTTAEWVSKPNSPMRDIGFIKLDRPFNGNLRLFNFIDTPPTGDIQLGVVGYPGDHSLRDAYGRSETGAQMYQEFARIRYDLHRSPNSLIEYNISTFPGQDGGPVLQQTGNGLVAIGCNTFGGVSSNAGNTIGGQYGNNYRAYLNLFDRQSSAFGTPGNINQLNV